MRNMLIRPSRKELEHFHPDYVIYNAGAFPANRYTTGMTSSTSVSINFADKEMVILGTEYAGKFVRSYPSFTHTREDYRRCWMTTSHFQ
jgi:phosphoenolpyruvate carboxykinase (ATP)